MDVAEEVRKKNGISEKAIKNTIKPYGESLGYEVSVSTLGSKRDTEELTDVIWKRNGKIVWRSQHKHFSEGNSSEVFYVPVRCERSSGYETDYDKLLSLPPDILDRLWFSVSRGFPDKIFLGYPFRVVPAKSILKWLQSKTKEELEKYKERLDDKKIPGRWSDFYMIPINELEGVEKISHYLS